MRNLRIGEEDMQNIKMQEILSAYNAEMERWVIRDPTGINQIIKGSLGLNARALCKLH